MPADRATGPEGGPSFSGIVLAGGASSRMGTDKAWLEVAGSTGPLVARAHDALVAAGAGEVLAIGGDADRLAALGFRAHADRWPGEGPLGGLVSGLELAAAPIAVVLTCDLPAIDAETVRAIVATLVDDERAEVAWPEREGRAQVLTAAYRTRTVRTLRERFEAGERSVHRALVDLVQVPVTDVEADALVDLDRPADIDHYARRVVRPSDHLAEDPHP